MKRGLLTLAILLMPAMLFAVQKKKVNGKIMPDPGQFVSQAVYISSNTCSEQVNLFVSSRTALLYGVTITTPSGTGGIVGVYNGRHTNISDMIVSSISATTALDWIFNVQATSGIAVRNSGGACISVIYLER